MMTITLKRSPDCLASVKRYFKFNYLDEWMDDPMVKQMVLDIDKTEVVSRQLAISPVLGPIPISSLSGGVQGLICILKDPDYREYSSEIFGDNCVGWLVKLSYLVDFTLVLDHPIDFTGDTPVNAVTAEGKQVKTCKEVWEYYATTFSSDSETEI